MNVFQLMGVGFGTVLTPIGIALMFVGVFVGIIFGALPGLSATMAIALFLPVTYTMEPTNAMTLLMALFVGAISGGLISAILLSIPGTPSSVATCFDGHPLVRKGQAAKALGLGVVFSFIGTLFSTILLMFIAPEIARAAVNFGSFEFFSIAIFSLTMVATLSSGNMVKGIMAAVIGFMFSTVGTDVIESSARFNFGITNLKGGFDMLAVMIGLFAIGEIISAAETSRHEAEEEVAQVDMKGVKGFGFSMAEFKSQLVNAFRSSCIGFGIGVLPGIGGGTSNVLAYTVAKNYDKHPEEFGQGRIDGVVASESANNATIGGAMVPLLTLGIPGDTTTAMLLGALTLHGLTPGPLLFQNQAEIVYGIFAAMLICSCIMLFMEFFGLRIFVKVLKIPKYILLPCVFVLCVIGAYALKNNVSQVIAALVFGFIGYGFKKLHIPTTPFILGFILGPLAEINYRRGMIRTKGNFVPFLTSPISAVFLLVALAVVLMYATKPLRAKKKAAAK